MDKVSLPVGWTRATIAEVGKSVTGNTPSTQNQNNYGAFIPFVKPPQLTDSQIDNTKEYLSEQGAKLSRVLPPFSVLVSCIGNLGKIGINKVPVAFNQQINAIIPFEGISATYLFYQAQSHAFRTQLESKATATTISIVNKGSFETVFLNISPLNEQHRIVAKIEELFSELDQGIDNLKTAQAQLKVYRQALLKHAFEGKLTAEWRAQNADKLESASALQQRIQHAREQRYQQQLAKWQTNGKQGSKPKAPKPIAPLTAEELAELPELPEGWCYFYAEELCDFITKGTTPSKEKLFENAGDVPFIKVYNLTKTGKLDFTIEPTFVSQETHNGFLNRSKVYPSDVLMNIVGPPLGKVSIVPNTHPEWNINQAIAIFRSEHISPKLLSIYLSDERIVNSMMSKSKATAGQFNLTLEICRETIIPIFAEKEQTFLEALLDERISQIDQLDQTITTSLQQAEVLRQSILKKAFSGELVPQDPNDEPASALLARIRAEKEAQTSQQAKSGKMKP